jgi:phosphohistidine swiveling domain-containing protein/transcription elongation factor Elf1
MDTSYRVAAGLSGEFYNSEKQRNVEFEQDDYQSEDSDFGLQAYWVVVGNDGMTYYIDSDGYVFDTANRCVGQVDPPAQGDPDRHAKVAGVTQTTIEFRAGIHNGTAMALSRAGIQATVTFPGGEVFNLWEWDGMGMFMRMIKTMQQYAAVVGERETPKGPKPIYDFTSIPITVSTPDDREEEAVQIIHEGGMAGRMGKTAGYSIQGQIGGATGVGMGIAVRPDQQSREEIAKMIAEIPQLSYQQDRGKMKERGYPVKPYYEDPSFNRGGSYLERKFAFDPALPGAYDPVQPGYIVVADHITPDHNDLFMSKNCRGIVSGSGGKTAHAIVVAMGLGIPAVVGVKGINTIQPGDYLQISGSSGIIYGGAPGDTMGAGETVQMDMTPVEAPSEERFVWSLGNYRYSGDPATQGWEHTDMTTDMLEDGELDPSDATVGWIYDNGTAEYQNAVSDMEAMQAWILSVRPDVKSVTQIGQEAAPALANKKEADNEADFGGICPHCNQGEVKMAPWDSPYPYACTNCGQGYQWLRNEPRQKYPKDLMPGTETFPEAWAEPGYRHSSEDDIEDPDPLKCPECGSHTNQPVQLSEDEDSQFRCLNCGNIYKHRVFKNPKKSNPEDSMHPFTAFVKDTTGNELAEGGWYTMYSPKYKIPDVVQIVKLEPHQIEARIDGDDDGHFPVTIDSDTYSTEGYSFEPFSITKEEEPEVLKSAMWKEARRTFTIREQQDLINENLEGRARNFDKINLEGTHYRTEEDDAFSSNDLFLW